MKKIIIVYSERFHSLDDHNLQKYRIDTIQNYLKNYHVDVSCLSRAQLPNQISDCDAILAAGGDGTVLTAAAHTEHIPLCGIRILPESSVGFLCSLDYLEFIHNIPQIISGNYKCRQLSRLSCCIDDSPLPFPFLNEILIAHASPARASRYEITFQNIQQIQCSSGIWIATAPGSHGAAHAAGAPELPRSDTHAVFCIRECSASSGNDNPLSSAAFLPEKNSPKIRILSQDHRIFFDGGIQTVELKTGALVSVKPHHAPLNEIYV